MTEEIKQDPEGAMSPPPPEKEGEEEQLTPVEALAKEMGWQEKGAFKGDDTNYVDAASYIKKGQDIQDNMRQSLKDQKRQLSDMAGSLTELKSHNERVYKAEVGQLKKELSTLKQQKKEAIEDGDVAKVGEIDEQIDTVKESMEPPKPNEQQAPTGDFETWIQDNDWYEKDKEMAAYADALADKHEGAPFKRVAALVTKQVKEMFPDKFPTSTTKSPVNVARVEAGARKSVSDTKFTRSDLSESQKSVMRQFVKQGIMTEKQYIEDIGVMQGGTR